MPHPEPVPAFAKAAISRIRWQIQSGQLDDDFGHFAARAYHLATGHDLLPDKGNEADAWSKLEQSGFDTWRAAHQTEFRQALLQLFINAANDIEQRYVKDGQLCLHRVVTLRYDPVQAILLGKRDLGVHWSHTRYDSADFEKRLATFADPKASDERAKPFGGLKRIPPTHFVFVCEASVTAVDWKWTLLRYVELWDFEKEINLREGQPLKLLAIFRNHKPLDISSIANIPLSS